MRRNPLHTMSPDEYSDIMNADFLGTIAGFNFVDYNSSPVIDFIRASLKQSDLGVLKSIPWKNG